MFKLLFIYSLLSPLFISEDYEKTYDKNFSYQKVTGIGLEEGVTRRDPSDVIKVNDTCYVYYTKIYGKATGYEGTIWYAISTDDGYNWQEKGEALGAGTKGTFDSHAVFTPNIIEDKGKYYLYYTGVRPTIGRNDNVFENNSVSDFTAIGLAVANSPSGTFERLSPEPVLRVSTDYNAFDSYRIDDASLLFREGKFWLYYKGRCYNDGLSGPRKTHMGVAFAESPEGPYIKYDKPILGDGHEVMVWKEKNGVAALASYSSTIEYAEDGLDFTSNKLGLKKKDRPHAPGAYRADLTDSQTKTTGLAWGISMVFNGANCYLTRYTFE